MVLKTNSNQTTKEQDKAFPPLAEAGLDILK